MLEVSKIVKSFVHEGGLLKVLDDISFSIVEGEILAIAGPSGCGKSTLLQIIGGLQSPSSGKILYSKENLRREVNLFSHVFQEKNLFPWKTVRDNLLIALKSMKLSTAEAQEKSDSLINMVGLSGFETYFPHQLSGGMKQRAALARALLTTPKILLLDEPFSSLDAEIRERLQEEIRVLSKRLLHTTVIVSHNLEEIVYVADRVLILSDRPSRMIRIHRIDLPKVRNPDIRTSEAFFKVKSMIWKSMRKK